LTSITLRLNLADDEKSTVLSLGKLFHTLITVLFQKKMTILRC